MLARTLTALAPARAAAAAAAATAVPAAAQAIASAPPAVAAPRRVGGPFPAVAPPTPLAPLSAERPTAKAATRDASGASSAPALTKARFVAAATAHPTFASLTPDARRLAVEGLWRRYVARRAAAAEATAAWASVAGVAKAPVAPTPAHATQMQSALGFVAPLISRSSSLKTTSSDAVHAAARRWVWRARAQVAARIKRQEAAWNAAVAKRKSSTRTNFNNIEPSAAAHAAARRWVLRARAQVVARDKVVFQ